MLLALILLGILGVTLGRASGLITFLHYDDPVPIWTIAVIAFFIPALAEELVFRVGLPAFLGDSRRADALALAAFILWHPVQVWLGLPMHQPVFLDPVFLGLAALMGVLACGLYRRSGSIWPAVTLHWLVVLGWKALGG